MCHRFLLGPHQFWLEPYSANRPVVVAITIIGGLSYIGAGIPNQVMESDTGLVNVLIGADLKAVYLQGLNPVGQVPGSDG